jgi:hypothetical protein
LFNRAKDKSEKKKNFAPILLYNKKFTYMWLSLCIVTYFIEYLGEIEFIFETILGYVVKDKLGYFEVKRSKISC